MTERRPKQKLTLEVDQGTADIWRQAAAELGYTSDSGMYVGQGSISQLFGAIAAGQVDPGDLADTIRSVTVARVDPAEDTQ